MGSVTLVNAVAINTGSAINLTDPGTGLPAVKALGVDVNGNSQLNVLNQTGKQDVLLAAAGTLGQVAVPNDSTGLVVYSGTAGGAQLLQSGGARLIIDCSTYSTTTGTNLTNYYTLTTQNWRYVYFDNIPPGCTPIVVTLPTSGYSGQLISFSCAYADNTAFTLGVLSNGGTNAISVRCSQELTLVYSPITSAALDWQIFDVTNIAADNYGTYPATRPTSPSPLSGNTPFGIAGGIAYGIGANGALAIGSNAQATNNQTLAVGSNSLAAAIGAVALGPAAQATGVNSLAIGPNSIASGTRSVAISMGSSTQIVASGANSIAQGTSSLNMGVATRSAGGVNNNSKVVYEYALVRSGATTGTSELFLNGGTSVITGAAGTTNRFAFPVTASIVWLFICDVIGRVPGDTVSLFHVCKTCLFHINAAGSITTQLLADIVAPSSVGLPNNLGTLANVVSIGSDATDKAITLSVTMASNTDGNMNWTAFCEVRRAY
jgi:hypothetical protein